MMNPKKEGRRKESDTMSILNHSRKYNSLKKDSSHT